MEPPKNGTDPVGQQLQKWKKDHKGNHYIARNLEGAPVESLTTSLTVGPFGPMVMHDVTYFKMMSNFSRRLNPTRPMCGKGQGAHGYFEVTKAMSHLTSAVVFSEVNKKTPLFGRFSSNYALGMSDNCNTLHTMSIKMYSEDGNFDILAGHLPVFEARDPFCFIFGTGRAEQVNPQTGIRDDNNAIWDFNCLRPERLHATLIRNSTRGFPHSFRTTPYYAINVFKMINASGEVSYIRYHFEPTLTPRFQTRKEALDQGDLDPFFHHRDLYNAIENGENPTWTLSIQVIREDELADYGKKTGHESWDPFDPTKVWPQDVYPLQEVGKVVFNRNQTNHYNEAELSCFTPGNLIPGIEEAPQDRILAARILAYHDSHMYRVGTHFAHLPINQPKGLKKPLHNYERAGAMNYDTVQGGAPNYYPNSFGGPTQTKNHRQGGQTVSGTVGRFDLSQEDNYTQPGMWYRNVISKADKDELVDNLVESLRKTAHKIQVRAIEEFEKIDSHLASRVSQGLKEERPEEKIAYFASNLIEGSTDYD